MESAKLKLNEDNEIKFKIHVQGTTSEPGSQDPQFRFTLTEDGREQSSIGYIFPVKKESNGQVSVVIPALEGILKENKSYTGKMEVLMGTRYFTPSSLQITFEKEFKVTAEAVLPTTNNNNNSPITEQIVVTSTPTISTPIKKAAKLNLTSEDIKRADGDDNKLKRIIAESLAKQLSPKSKDFIPTVEKTFNKIKSKLSEAKILDKSPTQNDKIDVEDLLR